MSKLADKTMGELERMEWKAIASALADAQLRLEADGVRHSWLDAPLDVAKARAAGEVPTFSRTTLTEDIVRAAYQRFMHEAEYPCSPSAMREAIDYAIGRMAPEQAEALKLVAELRGADFAFVSDNRLLTTELCKQAAAMIEALLA